MPTLKSSIALALAVLASTLFTACGGKTPVQSVPWYKAHDVERQVMLDQCATNPGELMATPNCINARTAATHLEIEGKIHSSPLPLPDARPGKPGRAH